MRWRWTVGGAVLGFLGVALGAFGAHGLEDRLGEEALALWRTGVLYQLTTVPGLLVLGVLPEAARRVRAAGLAFTCGVVLFSGSLYALALGGPRWLGAVTPVGGLGLLAGWALLALSARGLTPRQGPGR